MSEPGNKQRASIDLDEFERRLRSSSPAGKPIEDPLSELARLVGQQDPFKTVFAKVSAGPDPARREPAEGPTRDEKPSKSALLRRDLGPGSIRIASDQQPRISGSGENVPSLSSGRGGPDSEQLRGSVVPDQDEHGPHDGVPGFDHADWRFDPSAVASEPAGEDEHEDHGRAAGGWETGIVPPAETRNSVSRSSRTGIVAVASLLLLGGAVVAGTFVIKGSSGLAGVKEMPVIKAAEGPTKIQPENPGGIEVPNQSVSVLEKSAANEAATAKVVASNDEQPVDLAQEPQSPRSVVPPAIPATAPIAAPAVQDQSGNGIFPEPKKVKTVSVRPDGSVIANDTAPASAPMPARVPAPVARPAALGSGSASTMRLAEAKPGESPPAAKPSTPKTAFRAATTPKAPTAPQSPPLAADPPAELVPAAKAKPVHMAAAKSSGRLPEGNSPAVLEADPASPPLTTGSASGGNFAVQLAAPSTEQEARDASGRLQKKFANEFGSYKLGIRKADLGDKSVYRVRIGNLSSDEANALCSKVKAGGGSCFVARN